MSGAKPRDDWDSSPAGLCTTIISLSSYRMGTMTFTSPDVSILQTQHDYSIVFQIKTFDFEVFIKKYCIIYSQSV